MMRHKKVCITIIITISKPKKKEKILNQPYTNIYNNSIIITLYKTLLAPYITRTSVCLIFVFEKISTTKTIPTKKKSTLLLLSTMD